MNSKIEIIDINLLNFDMDLYLLLFQGRNLMPSETKLPHTAASCAGLRSSKALFLSTIASQSSFSPRMAAAVSPRG